MALPEVVSREDWLEARVRLLTREKEQTRAQEALNAERRRLPMVRITKTYVFSGPEGPVRLADLFGDQSQLIIQHVMFDPGWDAACPGCTASVDALSDRLVDQVRSRDTAFALVAEHVQQTGYEGRFRAEDFTRFGLPAVLPGPG